MSVMPLNSGEIVYMENDHKIRYSHVNDRFREGNLNFSSLACTINTWSTNTTIASYHGHGPNNNVSLYVIYHPLALIKTSTILLRMVFMPHCLYLDSHLLMFMPWFVVVGTHPYHIYRTPYFANGCHE